MSTNLKSPINWLFPDVRKRVLALLLGAPEERWYMRDIARRTGCALGTVRRELAGLADAEIVKRFPDGNRTYYQANTESPIFEELHGLIVKTAGLVDVVRAAMEPLSGNIDLAFIYGSQASGEASAASDVDLLIVGDVGEMSLIRSIAKAEEQLGRTVNYSLLSRNEFAVRRKEKGGFLGRVLSGKKITIMGNADEV